MKDSPSQIYGLVVVAFENGVFVTSVIQGSLAEKVWREICLAITRP